MFLEVKRAFQEISGRYSASANSEVEETEAISIQDQRDALNKTLNRWSDDRDALNLIIREKWTAINLLKNKRDEINQSVKNLKEDESLILIQLDAKNNRYIDLTKKFIMSFEMTHMLKKKNFKLQKTLIK